MPDFKYDKNRRQICPLSGGKNPSTIEPDPEKGLFTETNTNA